MEILFKRMEANNIAVIILNTSNRWLGIALVKCVLISIFSCFNFIFIARENKWNEKMINLQCCARQIMCSLTKCGRLSDGSHGHFAKRWSRINAFGERKTRDDDVEWLTFHLFITISRQEAVMSLDVVKGEVYSNSCLENVNSLDQWRIQQTL